MRALSDSEVKAIQSTVESITARREIVALGAYGSQVAGYATKESDYDVVLVVKPFTQRIKYYYLNGETEAAALATESDGTSKSVATIRRLSRRRIIERSSTRVYPQRAIPGALFRGRLARCVRDFGR